MKATKRKCPKHRKRQEYGPPQLLSGIFLDQQVVCPVDGCDWCDVETTIIERGDTVQLPLFAEVAE